MPRRERRRRTDRHGVLITQEVNQCLESERNPSACPRASTSTSTSRIGASRSPVQGRPDLRLASRHRRPQRGRLDRVFDQGHGVLRQGVACPMGHHPVADPEHGHRGDRGYSGSEDRGRGLERQGPGASIRLNVGYCHPVDLTPQQVEDIEQNGDIIMTARTSTRSVSSPRTFATSVVPSRTTARASCITTRSSSASRARSSDRDIDAGSPARGAEHGQVEEQNRTTSPSQARHPQGNHEVPARPQLTVYRSISTSTHSSSTILGDEPSRHRRTRWREGRWQRRRSRRQAARGAGRPPASSRRCSIETDTGITDGFAPLPTGPVKVD